MTGTPYDIDDANADFRQQWGLDQLGNWADFQEDANGDTDFTDAGDLDQDRTSNDVNEITNITEGGSQSAWVTPAYDDNGNMEQGPSPADGTANHKYIYDAWNRLVEITDNSDVTIATYEYDGLNRRIVKIDELANPDDTYDYYYNTSWQIVQVRKGDPDPLIENVYHPHYIDALAYRLYDANLDGTADRQYFAFDANFNVTTLANSSGTAIERYEYDSYGQVTILDADFSDDGDGVSDYEQHHLFAGYRLDAESGLYKVRNRVLHPALGRWMQRDPLEYVDGMSVYQFVASRPSYLIDAFGLDGIILGAGDPCFYALRDGGRWYSSPAMQRRYDRDRFMNGDPEQCCEVRLVGNDAFDSGMGMLHLCLEVETLDEECNCTECMLELGPARGRDYDPIAIGPVMDPIRWFGSISNPCSRNWSFDTSNGDTERAWGIYLEEGEKCRYGNALAWGNVAPSIDSGLSQCDFAECLKQAMRELADSARGKTTYNPFYNNSNSVIGQVLRRCSAELSGLSMLDSAPSFDRPFDKEL